MGLSNRLRWSSNADTLWSVSRVLLGAERTTTTFFQPFHAIYERGTVSEHTLTVFNENLFASFFSQKKRRFGRSEGSLFNDPEAEDSRIELSAFDHSRVEGVMADSDWYPSDTTS